MDERLRDELLEMERVDREVRADLVARGELHRSDYHPEMEAVHRRHNARMQTIIDAHGWPGHTLVGEAGCRAAGFVVQHAILDPALQRRCIGLLADAAARDEADPFMLALLTDRVLMCDGQPQIYGTQYIGAEGGGVEPWPIAEPETVDERRRAVGLMRLADNTSRLNVQHLQEAGTTGETPLACDLHALNATEQKRRQALAERLHAAGQEVRELPDGYAFRFPADLYLVVANFVALERRCCPFFRFEMDLEADGGPLWLRITGRAGVKDFVRAELGLIHP